MSRSPSYPLADPEVGALDEIVDLQRYPQLTNPDGAAKLGASMGAELQKNGAGRLEGFLTADAVATLAAELRAALPYVRVSHDRRSAYAEAVNGGEPLPESDWIAGHVTRDMIPAYSVSHRLYVSPVFKRLIAAAVGSSQLFEYADPLAGLVATVLPPGGCYGWHYDTNPFVVTIGVEQAPSGGKFEYYPNLRRPGDENLAGLRDVLSGQHPNECDELISAPGDLTVFLGRYSLHRVSEVTGGYRITLVLSYADRPGVIGPVERTRRVYGRVTEAHLLAESGPLGADGLLR